MNGSPDPARQRTAFGFAEHGLVRHCSNATTLLWSGMIYALNAWQEWHSVKTECRSFLHAAKTLSTAEQSSPGARTSGVRSRSLTRCGYGCMQNSGSTRTLGTRKRWWQGRFGIACVCGVLRTGSPRSGGALACASLHSAMTVLNRAPFMPSRFSSSPTTGSGPLCRTSRRSATPRLAGGKKLPSFHL